MSPTATAEREGTKAPLLHFEYEAVGSKGQRVKGHLLARSEVALDRSLERRGLVLTEAKVVPDGGRSAHRRLKHGELVAFTSQLSTLLGAGVPLVQALRMLEKRLESRAAREVVGDLLHDIEAGRTFAEALASQPRSFPPVYQAAVLAGEHSMELPTVLRRQAKNLEWVKAVRGQVTQALVYPAILALALLGLVTILLTFLLPRLVKMMPGGTEQLPSQTRAVMQVSDFLRANGLLLLGGVVVGVAALLVGLRDPRLRVLLARIGLRLPRVGKVLGMIATARFATTASLLHNAGCEVVGTLELGGRSCGNPALAAAFQRVAERVRRGQSITDALEREPDVDPFLLQLVAVGETSGELGACLEQVGEAYDEEVPRQVRWALALLEPAILVGGGGVVAFLLVATMLPIFSVYESLGG